MLGVTASGGTGGMGAGVLWRCQLPMMLPMETRSAQPMRLTLRLLCSALLQRRDSLPSPNAYPATTWRRESLNYRSSVKRPACICQTLQTAWPPYFKHPSPPPERVLDLFVAREDVSGAVYDPSQSKFVPKPHTTPASSALQQGALHELSALHQEIQELKAQVKGSKRNVKETSVPYKDRPLPDDVIDEFKEESGVTEWMHELAIMIKKSLASNIIHDPTIPAANLWKMAVHPPSRCKEVTTLHKISIPVLTQVLITVKGKLTQKETVIQETSQVPSLLFSRVLV